MAKFREIDSILKSATETGAVPGVVAVAADAGGIIYDAAYGKSNIASSSKMTLDTVFWIASMTKAITATAAMQLVEKDLLFLDGPISDVVPDLSDPQVLLGFSTDGQPQLRSAKRSINLRQLMTHTSGMGYGFCNPLIQKYIEQQGITQDTGDIDSYRLPLLFDPGDRWEYGVGIDWVGRAVEIASGRTLEEYLRQHIFSPLGMTDTAFKRTPGMEKKLSSMHARMPEDTLTKIDFTWPQQASFYSGGGGLYSTAQDYVSFLQMLLHDGQFKGTKILQPETAKIMKQNHIGDFQAGQLKTVAPDFSNDLDFFPGMQQRWGMSFLINLEPTPEGRSAGSIAWAGLSNCYYWVDSNRGVCGAIFTQILPFADPKVLTLFRQFEAGIYRGLNL